MTKHRKALEGAIMEALRDTTKSYREVGAMFGYSRSYMAALAQLNGFHRKRGGDRKSPAARARFAAAKAQAAARKGGA